MKKNILIICVALFIFQGCNFIEQRRKEKELENKILHEKIIEEIKRDSFLVSEEKKAIGEIMFNISEIEFNEKQDSFLNKCFKGRRDYYYTDASYKLEEDYYNLGSYGFKYITPAFNNDSLFWIYLLGKTINYDEYDKIMEREFNALVDILTAKYGNPILNYGLLSKSSIDKDSHELLCTWKIGREYLEKKQVDIVIHRNNQTFSLDLSIFLIEQKENSIREYLEKKKKSDEKDAEIL